MNETSHRTLHVVERWTETTGAAVLQLVAAAPGREHHLLCGTAAGTGLPPGHGFATVGILPGPRSAQRRALRARVSGLCPDVVHAHGLGAGRLAGSALGGRRVVYSPHGFAYERGGGAVARARARIAERRAVRRAAVVVTCAPRESRDAVALGGRSVVQVPAAPRIPALAMFETRVPGRVVGIGRIDAQHDPDFFRTVVLALRRGGHPGLDARWLGEPDDRIASLRLERAGIAVSGWLSPVDLLTALGAAGVYVHTARWDGMPATIADAVELGIPVIARDVPTLAGATATPRLRSPGELAAAVEELLAGGEAARDANLEAWRRVLGPVTPRRQELAIEEAYG